MIQEAKHLDKPAEVSRVLISTGPEEAYAESARIRRMLPRGAGWVVRTLKRYVRAENVTAAVWVVVVTRGADAPEHSPAKLGPSQCAPDDPSGDLQ